MTQDEISHFDVEKDVSFTSNLGYILEVDLEYPEELHLKHNSYPLAAQRINIDGAQLSGYSQDCLEALGRGWEKYTSLKLTSSFFPR